jgi:heterodisulfide reductase subunit A-like polyferredoxin
VFVAGGAAGPKDIPDAIVEAGDAAMAAAAYLEWTRRREAGSATTAWEGVESEVVT